MKTYKLIIFDWDGTIVDSFQKIVFCIQSAAKESGLPVPHDKTIHSIIGLSFQSAWPALFPHDAITHLDRFFDYYRHYFYRNSDDSKLFKPVKKLLKRLQADFLLAVATGKGRRSLEHEMAKHDLAKYFIITKTTSECFSKPNPQMLEEILEYTGVDAQDAIIIGDSIYDIQMAFNADIDAIHITTDMNLNYGISNKKVRHKITCISELEEILIINNK